MKMNKRSQASLGLNRKVLRLAFVCSAILVAVLCLVHRQAGSYKTVEPSWDEMNNTISELKTHEGYRIGSKYVASLEAAGTAYNPIRLQHNDYQFSVINLYLSVQFASTITREQIELLKKSGSLPFEGLSTDQQAALMKLRWYCSGDPDMPVQYSSITIYGHAPRIQLTWRITHKDRAPSAVNWGLSDGSDEVAKIVASNHIHQPDVVAEICGNQSH